MLPSEAPAAVRVVTVTSHVSDCAAAVKQNRSEVFLSHLLSLSSTLHHPPRAAPVADVATDVLCAQRLPCGTACFVCVVPRGADDENVLD